MNSRISGSVGRQGANHRSDVKLVQQLLNRARGAGQFLLRVDGYCGSHTIAAIEEFQSKILQFRRPDGIVRPLGPTITALSTLATHPTGSPHTNQLTNRSPNGAPLEGLSANDKIAWSGKVSQNFKQKVIAICKEIDVAPDFLMAAMAFESGETFSPSANNAAGSGAVGLIQFMPNTAKALGTSTEALAAMTAEDQLDYVKSYFAPHKGQLQTLEDVYMAILYPAAIGTGSDHVLFKDGTIAYTQNKGLDKNKDGDITVGEATGMVRAKLEKGLRPGYAG
jgi:Transglycosylase SLT domain